MNRIKVLSKILSLIFMITALSIPFVQFCFDWLVYTGSTYSLFGISFAATRSIIVPQSLHQFVIYYLIGLIPSGILVICFSSLAFLFELYSKGLYFSKRNVIFYKWVGWTLIIHFFAIYLTRILSSMLLLTGPNYRIDLGSLSFGNVLTGLVILCISWVFNEANKIEEENQLTV